MNLALKGEEWRQPGLVALASELARGACEHKPIKVQVPASYVPKTGTNPWAGAGGADTGSRAVPKPRNGARAWTRESRKCLRMLQVACGPRHPSQPHHSDPTKPNSLRCRWPCRRRSTSGRTAPNRSPGHYRLRKDDDPRTCKTRCAFSAVVEAANPRPASESRGMRGRVARRPTQKVLTTSRVRVWWDEHGRIH
jgi:hypothetical protein